jgi:hypothetical protein
MQPFILSPSFESLLSYKEFTNWARYIQNIYDHIMMEEDDVDDETDEYN